MASLVCPDKTEVKWHSFAAKSLVLSPKAQAGAPVRWLDIAISVLSTVACGHPTRIRLQLAIYFLPLGGKAIKRLHGANCAESFGI